MVSWLLRGILLDKTNFKWHGMQQIGALMKDGFAIALSWKLFRRSMLASLPILGIEDPKAFHRDVRRIYRREMDRLPEYGPNDVLKMNLAHAVMLSAIYEACSPKPDIDTLTRFYQDFLTRPRILRWFWSHHDMVSPSEVGREAELGARSQKAAHPYTWRFTVETHGPDRYTATFTRCGIYDYLKSRGMAEIVPAMCAIDYTMAEMGSHFFLRDTTIATGGATCDCTHVRASAATEAGREQSRRDRIAEARRGGRSGI